jgi:hypothetical protein
MYIYVRHDRTREIKIIFLDENMKFEITEKIILNKLRFTYTVMTYIAILITSDYKFLLNFEVPTFPPKSSWFGV